MQGAATLQPLQWNIENASCILGRVECTMDMQEHPVRSVYITLSCHEYGEDSLFSWVGVIGVHRVHDFALESIICLDIYLHNDCLELWKTNDNIIKKGKNYFD